MDTETLTTRQAADELGITQNGVLGAIKLGTLEAEKVDGNWRITRDAVKYYGEHHRGKQGQVSKEVARERAQRAAKTNKERRAKPVDEEALSQLGAQLWEKFFAQMKAHGLMAPDAPTSPNGAQTSPPAFGPAPHISPSSDSAPQEAVYITVGACEAEIARLERRIEALEKWRGWREDDKTG